jgi:IS5 family transposase
MAMLRIHLMQNWFGYSDPAMEEALYETTILRQFAGLSLDRIADETTILNFRRLLEKHELAGGILQVINGYLGDRGLMLRQGMVVDATIIHAPSSTKNKDGKRDPEMHQTKKGNQYFFGMKAHIGVDAESGLVHSLVGTAANVADVTQVDQLLHGEETYVSGDAGYTGVDKRAEHQDRQMIWSIAARPSCYKKHGEKSLVAQVYRKIEFTKAQLRAKVEHPLRVIKRQFGYTKVRFRGLAKNTAQQATLLKIDAYFRSSLNKPLKQWVLGRSMRRSMTVRQFLGGEMTSLPETSMGTTGVLRKWPAPSKHLVVGRLAPGLSMLI